jgi:dienelactone hydrolase
MLFVQGARDALAATELLVPMVKALGRAATLYLIDQADHSFHVPVRSGRTDAKILAQALDQITAWIQAVLPGPP